MGAAFKSPSYLLLVGGDRGGDAELRDEREGEGREGLELLPALYHLPAPPPSLMNLSSLSPSPTALHGVCSQLLPHP